MVRKQRKETEQHSEFKEYVKQRLREGNPLKAEELQDIFKDVFSEFFEAAFNAELEGELEYSKYDYKNKTTDNSRNGYSKKLPPNSNLNRNTL